MLRLFGPDCTAPPIDVSKVSALPSGAIWIDLFEPTHEEEALAEKLLGSNIPTRAEMLEIEPSSRLYLRQGAAYMTMSVLFGADERNPENDPVSFILTDKHLVTVRYIDPKPFLVFAEHLYSDPEVAQDSRTLFVRLLDAIIDRLADEFEECGAEIGQISHRIFAEHAHRRKHTGETRLEAMLMRIGKAQHMLTKLKEGAVSAIRLLTFLESSSVMDGDKASHRHVESLIADARALSDHSNFLGENLTFLLDASLGLINLEQNDVMKVFSIVAVVLMPPTLLAGIYGMNFEYMPELKWLFGYPYALVLILLSAILPYWWARRKGWL